MTAVPSIQALLTEVYSGAPLLRSSFHGETHWQRVALAGVAVCARVPAANPLIVLLFALLHDARRIDEGFDPAHGPRAASLAGELARQGLLCLGTDELSLLRRACARHTHATRSDDPTLGACWDADRCDLRRFNIEIEPNRMSLPYSEIRKVLAEVDDGMARFPGWEWLLS
jgi:uncharacterized protein